MADVQQASTLERQALLRKLIDGDENTRRSVAHDLHDELSPYLVALQPLVRTLQMKCAGRPELDELSRTVNTLVSHQSHILAKLRDILMGLHPPELETYGLRGAIERLLAQPLPTERGTALQVAFDPGGDWQSFGVTLDISIYRLVQECLTNARRHACGARVEVRFDPRLQSDGRPQLGIDVVNDCEPGVPLRGMGGLGVPGMRDRCMALGGTFQAGHFRSSQWRVAIRLPLDQGSHQPTPT